MIGIFLALFMVLMGSSGAAAQGCGPTNPNCVVPTAPVGTSNNRAASTAFVQNANGTVNVLSFGCKGDGVTDDATCINNAANFARSLTVIDTTLCLSSTNCWKHANLYFPPLQYKVCSPINFTGFASTLTVSQPTTIEGYGAIIYAGTDCFSAGNPIISMIDDVGVKLNGLTIVATRCDGLFLPTNGIQIGVSNNTVNAHNNTWNDVSIRGCFQYAPAYLLAPETFLCSNCTFQQGYNSASYSLILDDRNTFNITDPFGHTPFFAPGTHHSNIGQTFNGGEFISTNAGAGQAMFISGNEKLVLQNTYINAQVNTTAITINTDIINSNRLFNWNWQVNIEGANITSVFKFTGSQNPVINGFQFSANNVSALTSLFTIGSGGVSSVTFNGADIRIGSFGSVGATIFDNPANYAMSGLVMLPSGNHWNEPVFWNGCVFIATVSTCATNSNRYSALTFGTLPTAAPGTVAYIVDGLAGNCADGTCTTFGTNVTGGTGAIKLLLWFNGTNWTLAGK